MWRSPNVNVVNLKTSWNSLRCKYQLKQITRTIEKNNATNKNYILRQKGLKFQNPWNKQNWMNKELIMWNGWPDKQDGLFSGTAWKNKFNFWEIPDHIELNQPVFTIPRWPGKQTDPLPYNCNPDGHSIKQDRILFRACRYIRIF